MSIILLETKHDIISHEKYVLCLQIFVIVFVDYLFLFYNNIVIFILLCNSVSDMPIIFFTICKQYQILI